RGRRSRRRPSRPASPDSSAVPAIPSGILRFRLTPVFSRRRRVAQRLERLLDTQEVGGSSPPVPTKSRSHQTPVMSQLTATLPHGSRRDVPAGTSVLDVAAGISPRLAKAALVGEVDGRLVDLTYPLNEDAAVKIITADSPEGLFVYRHSTAHLLAAAVTNLF